MKLPNKVYDVLKWIVLVCIPAFTTAYVGLSSIWGFPYATEIVGTISAVDAFLGALLQISTNKYNAEQMTEAEG